MGCIANLVSLRYSCLLEMSISLSLRRIHPEEAHTWKRRSLQGYRATAIEFEY